MTAKLLTDADVVKLGDTFALRETACPVCGLAARIERHTGLCGLCPNKPPGEHVDRVCVLGHRHSTHAHSFETAVASTRTFRRPGRNDPCPCGSNKKYKHCCLA